MSPPDSLLSSPDQQPSRQAAHVPERGSESRPSLALYLLAVALLGGLLTTTSDYLQRYLTLESAFNSQQPSVEQATKVRKQFDTLAKGVAQLANGGNRNAEKLVAYLSSQGVKIEQQKQKRKRP